MQSLPHCCCFHMLRRWGTGFLFESTTKTLFAGDLFTQHGSDPLPVQEAVDIKKIKCATAQHAPLPLLAAAYDMITQCNIQG